MITQNNTHTEIKKENVNRWIKDQIDLETIKFANEFGKEIADNGLTTSQIRIAYGEMRRIQMNQFKDQIPSFLLLKPKLAYAVKRHNKQGLTSFFKLFSMAYEAIDINNSSLREHQFNNLMNLMEAILAYHKYHGGKE